MKSQKPDEELRFKRVAGMDLVFEPCSGARQAAKKHPCPDCHFCQSCSDARCHSCRSQRNQASGSPCRKLSLREQIALYERVNLQSKCKDE